MKKLVLFMSVMLLGGASLFAQIVGGNCYAITNTMDCDMQLCAMIGKTCVVINPETGEQQTLTTMIPDACTEIMHAGQVSNLCLPVGNSDEPNCHYEVMGYTMYNITNGEQIGVYGADAAVFTAFLNGESESYVFPIAFTGACNNGFVKLTRGPEGMTVFLDPKYEKPCGIYCFKNETGCSGIEICIRSEQDFFDDPCTEGEDGIALGNGGSRCIVLGTGGEYPTSGCLNFGLSPETGCYLCPWDLRIWVDYTGIPGVPLQIEGNTHIRIMCDGVPKDVMVTYENGVYVLR